MVVLVHTENRPQQATALDFVQIWAPLVRCMGANLVDKMPTGLFLMEFNPNFYAVQKLYETLQFESRGCKIKQAILVEIYYYRSFW